MSGSTALVPSSAYVAESDDDTDIDDLVPGVDWISASGKDGRFYDQSADEKVSLGENLKAVFLHAAPGQTAWAPKTPDRAGQVPHPDVAWFAEVGIPQGRPWCKNRDLKRQAPELSDDVTPAQAAALRARGYTGNCNNCPFRKWDRESKSSVCRESREILMVISGRPDTPARMTIDGTSLGPLKHTLKKEFKAKVDGRMVDLLICSRPISMGFKLERGEAGEYFILQFEVGEFLPEEQVGAFRALRELYLQYSSEAAQAHHSEEHADHEVPATEVVDVSTDDDAPPLTDADAPEPTPEEAAKAAAGFFS